ncbi:MAG: hypothetical protein LBU74_02130 [Methanobacteriaceae archaeon]|jgi:hypothetical protein|nr:hypothetical protein [Candidatus Methanorudis spinitermitis]
MKEKEIKIEDSDSFQTIFTKYGAMALDKQENLGQVIGENVGKLNIDEGTISFSDDLTFPVQILGTLANDTNNWHWAWDNKDIGFPEDIIQEAIKVKEFGERHDIVQFTTNILVTDLLEAHIIAMTVSGIFNDDAYYLVDFDEITFFITIKSNEIPKDETIERFINVFNKFQKEFNVKAKLAFKSYAKLRGYEYKERDEFSVAKVGQSRVIVGFSERGNVTHIQTMLE